jgi:hypothetical protein
MFPADISSGGNTGSETSFPTRCWITTCVHHRADQMPSWALETLCGMVGGWTSVAKNSTMDWLLEVVDGGAWQTARSTKSDIY